MDRLFCAIPRTYVFNKKKFQSKCHLQIKLAALCWRQHFQKGWIQRARYVIKSRIRTEILMFWGFTDFYRFRLRPFHYTKCGSFHKINSLSMRLIEKKFRRCILVCSTVFNIWFVLNVILLNNIIMLYVTSLYVILIYLISGFAIYQNVFLCFGKNMFEELGHI